MIVAGMGFSSKATESNLLQTVRAALAAHGMSPRDLGLIASIEGKRTSAALDATARELGVPLIFASYDALESVAENRFETHSELSMEKTGLPSVSEAAALACAGDSGELLGARLIKGLVTCALAKTVDIDAEDHKS